MTNILFQFGDNARIRIQIRTYQHWDKWHHSDPNLQWSQQAATSTPFLREQRMREIFALNQSINQFINRSIIQSFIPSLHQSIHQSFHPSIIQSIKQLKSGKWKWQKSDCEKYSYFNQTLNTLIDHVLNQSFKQLKSGKKGMKKWKVFYSGLMTKARIRIRTTPHWDEWQHPDPNLHWS